MSDSLQPHGLQYTRPPCSSPTPGAYSDSCPLSQWFHPTISSPVTLLFSCPQFSRQNLTWPNVITQTGFITRRMLELKILGKTHFLDLGVLAWKVRNFLPFCCQCLLWDEILSPSYSLRTLSNSLWFHIPLHGFILSIFFSDCLIQVPKAHEFALLFLLAIFLIQLTSL